ncbi:hypothetical protein, partial [Corynebacterium godavarianum]
YSSTCWFVCWEPPSMIAQCCFVFSGRAQMCIGDRFYNPQVAGADQVAAEVAQRVGGTPRANNDLPDAETQLPSEAIQNRNAITVVLAGR